MKAWLLLAFDEADVQTKGTVHYVDEADRAYRYDSRVHNHKQLAVNDIVLVRNKHALLGIAKIEQIVSEPGLKQLFRCPDCRSTHIKRRKSKKPVFKCQKCKSEFDEPEEELVGCDKFTAQYGKSFVGAEGAIAVAELRRACLKYNGFLSMQELSVESIWPYLEAIVPEMTRSLHKDLGATDHGESQSVDAFVPSEADSRESILAQIRVRRGQAKFRQALINRYGARCLVSGSVVLAVLEAAHISAYRGDGDNDPQNGVILRADLHTLFDLHLLGIEPMTLRVHLDNSLRGTEYEQFGGCVLACGARMPSDTALQDRWKAFNADASFNEATMDV